MLPNATVHAGGTAWTASDIWRIGLNSKYKGRLIKECAPLTSILAEMIGFGKEIMTIFGEKTHQKCEVPQYGKSVKRKNQAVTQKERSLSSIDDKNRSFWAAVKE